MRKSSIGGLKPDDVNGIYVRIFNICDAHLIETQEPVLNCVSQKFEQILSERRSRGARAPQPESTLPPAAARVNSGVKEEDVGS